MKITISKENYLKAIAEAESEGEPVIAATLARWLDVTPPAVTMALRRLRRDGLIRIGAESRLHLTPEGRAIADKLLMRHYLIERMLCEIFGMEWHKVHEEAEQLEHAVSADFERRLLEKLGRDAPCPHGYHIAFPTAQERRAQGLLTLDELAPEARASVVSVYERDRALLERFDNAGLRPGAQLTARGASGAGVWVEIAGHTLLAPAAAAARIWVRPAGAGAITT